MSAAKSTPGPWHVANGVQIRSESHQIAKVWMMRSGEGNANARLIAASPCLLAALKSFYLWAENQSDGQSKGGHATFDLMMLREQRDIAHAAIFKATGEAV